MFDFAFDDYELDCCGHQLFGYVFITYHWLHSRFVAVPLSRELLIEISLKKDECGFYSPSLIDCAKSRAITTTRPFRTAVSLRQ